MVSNNAKNVILVNLPPVQEYNYRFAGLSFPATGILVSGTILKQKGISTTVIDGAVRSDYEHSVLNSIDRDTVFVGFSVMTSQVPLALRLSRKIKQRYPEVLIVWGGIHAILFPEQTLRSDFVDIVVLGEGVRVIGDLALFCSGAISLDKIRGIGFKESTDIYLNEPAEPDEFNDFPFFDFSILPNLENYLSSGSAYKREIETNGQESLRLLPVLTGLGCCYRCEFCINVFLKRKYRFRNAADIVAEIKRLQNRYAVNAFVFYDEDFCISKKRMFEFVDLIENDNLHFYWRIWSRVNYFKNGYLDKVFLKRLERNGLRSIVMGAESGSQKILDLIRKDISVGQILTSAKELEGTRITPRYSFIVGLDGEEKTDIRKTYKLCGDLFAANHHTDISGPFIFRFYPGSPIFNRIMQKYSIALPKNLEDWENALSPEGFLKIDRMPWVWQRLNDVVFVFNMFVAVLVDRLRRKSDCGSNFLRKILIFRLRSSFMPNKLELYFYVWMKRRIRYLLKTNGNT